MISGSLDRHSLSLVLGLIISTPTGSTAYAMAGKRIRRLDCPMRTSRESSWCFYGSSQCSCDSDLSYLSAFIIVSSDCRAGRYRTQSESVRQFSTDGMALRRWKKSTRTPTAGQVVHLCASEGLQRADLLLCAIWSSVRITTSVYPVPVICRFNQLGDWFESLADILNWNVRKSQLNLGSDAMVKSNELTRSPDEDNQGQDPVLTPKPSQDSTT